MADSVRYGSLPFDEQIRFFRQKVNLPTAAWTDILNAQHDRAFVVAGAQKAELLDDLRRAVDKAIAEGTTLHEFRRDFAAVVKRHGWSHKGSPGWRSRVIYETNLRTSYQAGRLAQMRAVAADRPYWRYRHNDSVLHPRPQHVAWDGLVLAAGDAWWRTHFPPNGWGCRCFVQTLREKDLAKLGKTVPDEAPPIEWEEKTVGTQGPSPRTVRVPTGIDPGFGYAPGASWVQGPARTLEAVDAAIGAQFWDEAGARMVNALSQDFGLWFDRVTARGQKAGERSVVGALSSAELRRLRELGVELDSAAISLDDSLVVGRKAARHEAVGDNLTETEWRTLPERLYTAEAVLYERATGNLLIVSPPLGDARRIKVVVRPGQAVKKARVLNRVATAFKISAADLQGGVRGGDYTVVRGALQ